MGNCLNFFGTLDEDPFPSNLSNFECVSPTTMINPTPSDRSVNDQTHPVLAFHSVLSTLPVLEFYPILPFSTHTNLGAIYELGPELGRGRFGIVRECSCRKSGEKFACKSISKLHMRTSDEINNVIREIRIMKRLSNHSSSSDDKTLQGCHVVHLHEIFEDVGFVHLIIDLCSGGELFDRITRSKRCSEKQAALLMKILLEALQFCHSMGIIHRDVKPENLLLVDDSEDSAIKLADFGLALEFSPGQKFSDSAGSAYYMSPELLQGEYSEEVDLWSAGVIMYILLSGMPPFWGLSETDIFNAIRKRQLDLSSGPWRMASPSAKDLISKLLCVDVTERYTPAQALKHPWITRYTMMRSRHPIEEESQCQSTELRKDILKIRDVSEDSCHGIASHENGNIQNANHKEGIVFVNLCESIALGIEQRGYADLTTLMETLVVALNGQRLTLSESLSKMKLRFGWTCTMLTSSASEEILMVDMGQEKYLIAHDRMRKRLGLKVLHQQRLCHTNGKFKAKNPVRKIQPVF